MVRLLASAVFGYLVGGFPSGETVARLATRGATSLVTLLRLEELKPSSPLPLEPRG